MTENDPEVEEVETVYGRFAIPAQQDIVADALRKYGEWAQNELSILTRFVEEGETVVDGGGCFGTHARAFSTAVGPSGRVVSYEPMLLNFAILTRNAELAPHGNVEPRALALSDKVGKLSLHVDSGNLGGTSAETEPSGNDARIDAVRLDDEDLGGVSFIKLDIEGGEARALAGAERLLASQKPVVFTEANRLSDAMEVLRAMQGRGYFAWGIVTAAYRPENVNKEDEDIFQGGSECGLLFVHADRLGRHRDTLESLSLPVIETIDDLALLLAQQPQWLHGGIGHCAAGKVLPVPSIADPDHQTAAERVDVAQRLVEEAEGRLADVEEKLAAADSRVVRSEMEAEAAKRALERTRLELTHFRAESTKAELNLAQVSALVPDLYLQVQTMVERMADAQKLARKTGKFPFLLFFAASAKYRRLRRRLRRGTEVPIATIQRIGEWSGVPLSGTRMLGPTEEEHPAGPDALTLERLSEFWTKTHYMDELIRGARTPVLKDVANAVVKGRQHPHRPLILSFTQDNYLDVAGGTQLCTQIESRRAAERGFDYMNVHPVRPASGLMPEGDAEDADIRVIFNDRVVGICRYGDLVTAMPHLGQVRPVIHHLLCHDPASVARIIKACGDVPVIYWAHDYFTACRNPTLLRNTVSFCGGPPVESAACGICIYGVERPAHLARMRQFLTAVGPQVVAPSEAAAGVLRNIPDLPEMAITVRPHRHLEWTPRLQHLPQRSGPARVAFLGAPMAHKGWEEFKSLVSKVGRDIIEPVYFGSFPIDLDIEQRSVTVKATDPDIMARAIAAADIDLVLHFTRCAETFSFTAAEALEGGAWLVCNTRSGNVSRMTRETGRGIVLDDEADLLQWATGAGLRQTLAAARKSYSTEKCTSRSSDMSLSLIEQEVTA